MRRYLLIAGALVWCFGLSCGPPFANGAVTPAESSTTMFDGALTIEDGEVWHLETNSAAKAYVVLAKRTNGFDSLYVGGDKGTLDIDKDDLKELLIYRLEPIAHFDDRQGRQCNELPNLCPLPPPPPDWMP